MPKKFVQPNTAVTNSNNKSIHRVRKRISLRDRLEQLTLRAACRLLAAAGAQRLRLASRFEIVLGSADQRAAQYEGDGFFKICNYEQVVRDEAIVQRINWDLVIELLLFECLSLQLDR